MHTYRLLSLACAHAYFYFRRSQVPHTFAYWDTDYGVLNEMGVGIAESTCGARTVGWPVRRSRALCSVPCDACHLAIRPRNLSRNHTLPLWNWNWNWNWNWSVCFFR